MELKLEVNTFCLEIWHHLNQRVLAPLPDRWSKEVSALQFDSLMQCLAESSCTKTINLRALEKEDMPYLLNLGLNKSYLTANLASTLDDNYLDPLGFQLDAVRQGSISAICPFTGKTVVSRQSLLANINVIFYRFASEEIFYLAVAGIGSGFRKSALYFPESDLVVTAGDEWGYQPDDLLELKARMILGAGACYDYFEGTSEGERKTAVCLGVYHFAHHLWNELSGLHRLLRKDLLRSVDKYLVLREPLGPIEEIFPEVPAGCLERKDNTGELFAAILHDNYFVVRVGDSYLTRDLATRVARVSAANCSLGTQELVSQARRAHPLLWLGVRVGNRAWANQVDGLSEMIVSLHSQFPTLGVVFDGFSLPGDKAAHQSEQQGYTDILAQEHEVVNAIVENLQRKNVSVPLYNIIGLSIFDANVWAHAIDVYVSPYGSLQHKVGWFTNKHGVVHSNRTLLQHPARYVWEAVEGGIPPRYLSAASVTDMDSDEEERVFYNAISDAGEAGAGTQAANQRVRQNAEFQNYWLPWQDLHSELIDLIRSPRVKPRLRAIVFAHRTRRKIRNTMRGIRQMLH
jgi:hypothetical protein